MRDRDTLGRHGKGRNGGKSWALEGTKEAYVAQKKINGSEIAPGF